MGRLPEDKGSLEETIPNTLQSGVLLFRVRWAEKLLNKPERGQGNWTRRNPDPDIKNLLEAFSTSDCHPHEICISAGVRPWDLHHIVPLLKRGAASEGTNYRGVHLTSNASKAVEKLIGAILCKYFEAAGTYGLNQWAFRSNHSPRNLVTLCV